MAASINAKCRKCRAAGEKLFLKGERCFTTKCSIVKRAYPPGVRGKRGSRRNISEFGRQLLEKQRVKKIYGILERQLKRYFKNSQSQKGDARENLMRKLEMRLDNVVFRLGWVKSRSAARQLVNHGHILINGKRSNIPSCEVRPGDVISLRDKVRQSKLFENLAAILKKYEAPKWLAQDKEKIEAKVLSVPGGDDLGELASVGLIVEFYSR